MFRRCVWVTVLMGLFITLPLLAQAKLSDPTKPPEFVQEIDDGKTSTRTLKVSSIISSPHRKVAVIDGEIMGVGDQGAGFTVLTIESGQVIVELADSTTKAITLRKTGIVHKVESPGVNKNLDVASALPEGTE